MRLDAPATLVAGAAGVAETDEVLFFLPLFNSARRRSAP